MERPNSQTICDALDEYAKFFAEFGDANSNIPRFHEFSKRFREGKITKELILELVHFRDRVHNEVTMEIFAHHYLPGKDDAQTQKEYYRVLNALGAALHPPKPKPPKLDISKFAGAKKIETKTTEYAGDPSGVRPIVERSLELVKNYSEAVGRGDFEAAYRLTGAGLRDWMTLKRFVGAHEKAAREYGGPALQFNVEKFQFVLADDEARKKSTAEEGWPKTTSKDVRRSRLIGFWIRDKAAQAGCCGAFWITEEDNDYRVAKFEFFAP
jgi:hypothetical protein